MIPIFCDIHSGSPGQCPTFLSGLRRLYPSATILTSTFIQPNPGAQPLKSEFLASCHQLLAYCTTPSTRNLVNESYRPSVRGYFRRWKLATRKQNTLLRQHSSSQSHLSGSNTDIAISRHHVSITLPHKYSKTLTDADLCCVSVEVTANICGTKLGGGKWASCQERVWASVQEKAPIPASRGNRSGCKSKVPPPWCFSWWPFDMHQLWRWPSRN